MCNGHELNALIYERLVNVALNINRHSRSALVEESEPASIILGERLYFKKLYRG